MNVSRFLTILGFIAIGILSRMIPHPPNFTSINAIALFGIMYFGNQWMTFFTILLTLFFSDLLIGFHSTMPFVYLSCSLMILVGYSLKREISLKLIPVVCLGTSLLFFLITNFGVWMTGALYPKTLHGLELCYIAALPFFFNQLLGDITYGLIVFSYLCILKNLFRSKKLGC